MPAPCDVKGKAVLVTGAAAGLGRATALRFAHAGADICMVDISAEGLNSAADEVRSLGVRALPFVADLAELTNCRKAVDAAVQTFERLDALCNVAAVFIPCHAVEMSVSDWNTTIAVNLSAPFHLIQAAIPHLLRAKGAVVNVTSCAAFAGQAYTVAYCATKSGLNNLTKALAMEYMHQPIRFNAVAPGGMMTSLGAALLKLKDADPVLLKRYSPLRGVVKVEEVAEMIAFLASDAASGYHGACISIDNGITAG